MTRIAPRLLCCALVMALAAAMASAAADDAATVPVQEWNFRVTLDDKPIGEHRFRLRTSGGQRRQLSSEADFVVRFLGIAAYRYHHHATEDWQGNCLEALEASTEENGKTTRVHLRADDIAGFAGDAAGSACMMSFAYWNPAMRQQTRLINAQTGKAEAVRIRAAGSSSIDVRGQPVPATGWRISGPSEPIDVWYSAQGEWIGLDAIVAGGRRLSYRLR
jgi:Family of unknown function (DUF6134)